VLSVPVSYLIGLVGQCCCGARSEAELEMEKMDKIYQEVRRQFTCRTSFNIHAQRSMTREIGLINGLAIRGDGSLCSGSFN